MGAGERLERCCRSAVGLGLGGTLLGVGLAAAAPAPPALPRFPPEQLAHFESKVRPVLVERCYSCHGPKIRQAGLRLDSREAVLRGSDIGAVVQPGHPERSRLIETLRHTGKIRMPPAGRLRPDEIAALEEWVRMGLPWPVPAEGSGQKAVGSGTNPQRLTPNAQHAHWSFLPVKPPQVPRVKNAGWVRNAVDAFVLARLEQRGLKPAPPADRRTLIRRVTFDLTGLPPAPEAVEAFVTDRSPNAWEKVVDRLLASPQYGERWGRRWLDVARYADTAGETADYPVPQAYRYRNYVIDAFNRDKPYDRFLQEQIAGDVLAASGPPESYAESVTATGFLALSRRFGFDSENYHHLTIEDTIDTLGKSVLGLSVGCARCHDHKYDPVPTADYYSLYGIFASSRYAFPGSEEKKRPRDLVPVVPPIRAAALQKAYEAELTGLDAELKRLQGERDGLRAQVGPDGEFEFQAEGELPGLPWINGPNSQARVRAAAQSPFPHLHADGKQGVSFLNSGVYSGFGQPLPRAWTPATGDRLYFSADFRNTDLRAGGAGSFRYYAGHGPGVSAAVEAFVDGERFYIRTGDRIEAVRAVTPGTWHSFQLALDLKSRSYTGLVGVPGNLTPFSGKFAPVWDGTIDYYFVDTYGHRDGVRPAHDVDNLLLREVPLIPPTPGAITAATPLAGGSEIRVRLRELERRTAETERKRTALMERGPFETVYGVVEGTPQNARIQLRGDPRTLGNEVPRRFLTVLGGTPLPPNAAGSGRLQLAQWLTDPKNPLTARVMVNRVWQGHFGRGLVRTPNDFGTRGEKPTHPELLDYLASTFTSPATGTKPAAVASTWRGKSEGGRVGTLRTAAAVVGPKGSTTPTPPHSHTLTPGLGWSLKRLHKLIVMSSAYGMSSTEDARVLRSDPDNRLLSRQNRRRLDAEEIRDAMLAVSGDLDPSMGGAHPFPPVSTWGFTQHTPFTAVYETNRRSVYLMTQRIRKHPFLALFDGAEPNASTPERVATTTPIQALFALNDPFVHARALALARRLQAASPAAGDRIERAYRLCLGRPAAPAELREGAAFLQSAAAALRDGKASAPSSVEVELQSLAALVRVLLGSNAFFHVD